MESRSRYKPHKPGTALASLAVSSLLAIVLLLLSFKSDQFLKRNNMGYLLQILLFSAGACGYVAFRSFEDGASELTGLLQGSLTSEGKQSNSMVDPAIESSSLAKEETSLVAEEERSEDLKDEEVHRSTIDPKNVESIASQEALPSGSVNLSEPPDDWLTEVKVVEVRSFEEVPEVIKALEEGYAVVLNLVALDAEQAQRAVDFVAGGVFSLKGHQERIGESVFLFTPHEVKVPASPRIPGLPEQRRVPTLGSEPQPSSDSRPRLRLLDFTRREEPEVSSQ